MLSVAAAGSGEFDFGDLPDNYGTTLVADGARHVAAGPTLGALRDAEVDGLPTVGADGDDTDGGPDEDGVTFGSIMVGQLDATVTVNVQNAPSGAKLDAWVDFNGDGSFGGVGERIADTVAVVEEDNVIGFDVPSGAMSGETYARFRLSSAGDLGWTGMALDGEVEDYQVVVLPPEAAGGVFVSREPLAAEYGGAKSVFSVDVDGDGDMDVLSASYADDTIDWYRNDGNGNFTHHTIASSVGRPNSVFAADVDGDGDMDVLSASEGYNVPIDDGHFGQGWREYTEGSQIAWYENDGDENFTAHTIATSVDRARSVFAADVDGDGDMDVLSASQYHDRIAWYENDGNANFTAHTISESADGARSVFAEDVDGDGDMDVLSASSLDNKIAWYENDGNESFTAHTITTLADGADSVFAADVDGDGDMDVLSASGFDDRIAWYENDGNANFTTHTITNTADAASSVFAADMDGDGDIDVLSASHSFTPQKLAWYENDGNGGFTHRTGGNSTGRNASVFAADVDGDGDVDVLSASVFDDKIAWHENDGDESFATHAITVSANGAKSLCSADMDGDGDMDVLSTSYDDDTIDWYRNQGNGEFTSHTIASSVGRPNSVFAADVDGDGDMDVLSASEVYLKPISDGNHGITFHRVGSDIAWYENDGNGSFTPHAISTSADGATSVFAADVDGDGDLDVLSASRLANTIAWYENDGNAVFTLHTITTSATDARSVFATDVDGDGDMDVLSASWGDNSIRWYENDGTANFTAHTVTASAQGALAVSAADVDGDGDMDVLSASTEGDELAWYENDGSQNFALRVIDDSIDVARSVLATDLDGDGDMDILAATFINDVRLKWYENDGTENFTARTLYAAESNSTAVLAADMDGDGDLDVVSAYGSRGKVAWYEQLGPGAVEYDFGDAPDSYGTTLAADGVRHEAVGPTLGTTRDAEADGLPTIGADGDDTDGSADEDGVTFDRNLVAGQFYTPVTIKTQNASNGAKLDAWIDFDGNGSFAPDEQIADSVHVGNGYGTILFDIPVSAVAGETYARFRLSTAGGLAPTGPADDGEVEDYRVTIHNVDPDISTVNLGEVDYKRLIGLGYRDARYQFTSTRDGFMTIDARTANVFGEPYGIPVTFVLRDDEGNVLQAVETSASHARIDHMDPSGGNLYTLEIYAWSHVDFPTVLGGSPKIDLRICNLVSPQGPNVDVFGTSDADTFAVSISETYDLSVTSDRIDRAIPLPELVPAEPSEIVYSFDTTSTNLISFIDHEGSDTLTTDGVWGDQSAQLVPGAVEFQADGIDLRVQAVGVEHVTVNGGGEDLIEMLDESDDDTFASIMAGQIDASVTVIAQNVPSGTKLDAWIDFNGDGAFDANEQIAAAHDLSEGDNRIEFDVPDWAVSGQSFVRFRMSGDGSLAPIGPATDGDAEDYAVTILPAGTDFGDAPDSYGTTLAADGARHYAVGPTLGATRDGQSDGLPTIAADGDDTDGDADEDGVTFGSIRVGQLDATVTVNVQNAPSGAKLDAWIDFDGNGTFDPGEQIADNLDVVEGDNLVQFDVPDSTMVGDTYTRFRLSRAGDLAPTGSADDGEVEDYRIRIGELVELGDVDLLELPDLDLAAGAQYYTFSPLNTDGLFTIDATFDSAAGDVTLRLFDNSGEPVEEISGADGYLRMDYFIRDLSQPHTLEVIGSNTSVDLRIANLVSPGSMIEVFGTEQNADAFIFSVTDVFEVSINGIDYSFPLDGATEFQYLGKGDGSATLYAGPGDDTATMSPHTSALAALDGSYQLRTVHIANVVFHGGGGTDAVEIVDSTGNDMLIATPTQMSMSGTPVDGGLYTLIANGFRYAHGYSRNGGNDTAEVVGSADSDRVKAYPDFVKMMGGGYYNRVKFFESATVDMLDGADNGVMLASDTADAIWAMKNDVRIARDLNVAAGASPDYQSLAYDVTIAGCERFLARADGGDDWVELHDSPGKDVLIAKPHKVQMMNGPRPADDIERGDEYQISARGFRNVSSIADQGGEDDAAKLYDSGEEGVDIWSAAYADGETWSRMSTSTRALYEVLAFEQVGGYGFNGGQGENHGTNRKEHADDVDFVLESGYWESEEL